MLKWGWQLLHPNKTVKMNIGYCPRQCEEGDTPSVRRLTWSASPARHMYLFFRWQSTRVLQPNRGIKPRRTRMLM